MNDEQLDDLKQYFDSRLSQTEERLEGKIEEVRKEMADGFAGVGEAIETIHARDDAIETRVTTLEQKAA